MVQRAANNYYKTHRILSPNGTIFVLPDINNADTGVGGGPISKSEVTSPTDSAFAPNVTPPGEVVKSELPSEMIAENVFQAEQKSKADALEAMGINEAIPAENTRLTDADLQEYMKVGETLHTRNKKSRIAEAGGNPILTTAAALKSFLSSVIHGEVVGEVKAYGKVGTDLAEAVKRINPNIDISGYYLEISADSMRHAYLEHSQAKEAGDISLSENNFLSIPEYIDTADHILSVEIYKGKVKIRMAKKNKRLHHYSGNRFRREKILASVKYDRDVY